MNRKEFVKAASGAFVLAASGCSSASTGGAGVEAVTSATPVASPRTIVRETIEGVECTRDGKVVWRFNIANRESKPFVHPICLPDGRCVTDVRPEGHPWHLGLWFCWKFVNGLNYWEPREPAKLNLFPDGMTAVKDFKITPKGGACEVALSLWYGPRAEPGRILIEESRKVAFSAPDGNGRYSIRSTHEFTAREAVTLNGRRPIPYGGLTLRLAPMAREFDMTGDGGEPSKEKNVGGPKEMKSVRYVDPKSGHGVEMKMLAPLETERIYTWSDHRFVSCVPMYERPLELKPGEKLRLDYEVSVF